MGVYEKFYILLNVLFPLTEMANTTIPLDNVIKLFFVAPSPHS